MSEQLTKSEQVWFETWKNMLNLKHCKSTEQATLVADECLTDFLKRFDKEKYIEWQKTIK
jgi:hypothetical protein